MKSKTSFSCQAESLKRRSSAAGLMTGAVALAGQALRGRLPQLHVVLPEIDLGLHELGRIGHHPRRHFHEGPADAHGIAHAGCRRSVGGALRLALDEIGNKSLRLLGDPGHGARQFDRVRELRVRSLLIGHVRFLYDLFRRKFVCFPQHNHAPLARQPEPGPRVE